MLPPDTSAEIDFLRGSCCFFGGADTSKRENVSALRDTSLKKVGCIFNFYTEKKGDVDYSPNFPRDGVGGEEGTYSVHG